MSENETNWNQDQPIVLYLREVLPAVFPILLEDGHGLHRSGIGGYIRRRTHFNTRSAHSEGRAADIYLSAGDPYELSVANLLFRMFINHATELGVDNVIWNRQIWSQADGGPRPYLHDPSHRIHIHVEFTRDGSQRRPASLRRFVEAVAAAVPIECPDPVGYHPHACIPR